MPSCGKNLPQALQTDSKPRHFKKLVNVKKKKKVLIKINVGSCSLPGLASFCKSYG